jgi:AraC-like DNA-binding protein
VRIIRLKKAAELLVTTNLNVSEVSYKVGINDPFYFSKCFKAQFGKTPSAFQKEGVNGGAGKNECSS